MGNDLGPDIEDSYTDQSQNETTIDEQPQSGLLESQSQGRQEKRR